MTSLFLLLYAGLRFAVDLFRDYEAAWLGIGTGQVFNLAMATLGLIFLIRTLRSQHHLSRTPIPTPKAASWLQVVILFLLILYPLGIPTSWTRANIEQKRQEAMEEVQLGPPVEFNRRSLILI